MITNQIAEYEREIVEPRHKETTGQLHEVNRNLVAINTGLQFRDQRSHEDKEGLHHSHEDTKWFIALILAIISPIISVVIAHFWK